MSDFLFKNHAEIEARKLVPDLLFYKKSLVGVKANGWHFSFNIFW